MAETQSFAARLSSHPGFVTWELCDLGQMNKVLLLCPISSSVKSQQEYSVIHIIGYNKYPVIVRMAEAIELIKT